MHVGYAWLVVAFGLEAFSALTGGSWPRAWLHAFTVGAALAMLLLQILPFQYTATVIVRPPDTSSASLTSALSSISGMAGLSGVLGSADSSDYDAFNQLQTASHKLAEALYQQAPPPGSQGTSDQASAAGASSSGASSGGEDNVIDAEYVDVDENK